SSAVASPARPEEATGLAHARRNALRRLVRCLFAENILDVTRLALSPDGRAARFPLADGNAHLHFAHLVVAPARTIVLHGPITRVRASGARDPVADPDMFLDLVRDQFDVTPSPEGLAGLKADIANSIANDVAARRHRQGWNRDLARRIRAAGAADLPTYLRRHSDVRATAILLDQWGALEGHP
ncbi:hypothetical protein, partial [Xanthomonas sacchari]|uniref:hypothetical protein n=1 Tax=Xanthomonas sacchari TaxID=56458 RepID=UPI00292C7FD3